MNIEWKSGFVHLAHYNRRINASMYQAVANLTDPARKKDRGSWFGSIMGILNHIIVTDIHWLDRFRPLQADAPALADGRLGSFGLEWAPLSDEFAVLAEGRSVVDDLISEWFETCPGEKYADEFRYEDSGGQMHTVVAARAFDFLFVHQNYHRGQVSQILDSLGVPHSFADNIDFTENH